jgi:hypothetical protein
MADMTPDGRAARRRRSNLKSLVAGIILGGLISGGCVYGFHRLVTDSMRHEPPAVELRSPDDGEQAVPGAPKAP